MDHWMAGFAFCAVLSLAWYKRVPRHALFRHPLTALILVLRLIYDLLLANFSAAQAVLFPKAALRPAWMEVPLPEMSPFAVAALAAAITLTPGTVVAEVAQDRRAIWVHVLSLKDAGALMQDISEHYARPLQRLFP